MYLAVTEKHIWGFIVAVLKTFSLSPQKPQPRWTAWSKPSPAHHTSDDPTCSLRKVDRPLFSEKKEDPRLFIKSWRTLPKSASTILLSHPKNGVSQTQTLQTTIIKIPPEPFLQTNIFNHAQLQLDRSHFTRSHFFPLAISCAIANQSMGHE